MSGVIDIPVTSYARLHCNLCSARWESSVYVNKGWHDYVEACAPAFRQGWRVYVGGRSQHTYCPQHGPTVHMRLLYPQPRAAS